MAKAKKKFKVLRSCHREGGKTYFKGDVVETENDLLKHNTPGTTPKFGSADDVVETEQTDDGLENLTLEELKSAAEEGGVKLPAKASKADVIKLLRADDN